MQKLLETGKTDLLDKFISKKGRPFKAFLVLKDGERGLRVRAPGRQSRRPPPAPRPDPRPPAPKLDFSGPATGRQMSKVRRAGFRGRGRLSLRALAGGQSVPANSRSTRVILQQPLDRAQAARLLSEKRTDLLPKFISKSGRPFSAFLVMDGLGKITFEFPPR